MVEEDSDEVKELSREFYRLRDQLLARKRFTRQVSIGRRIERVKAKLKALGVNVREMKRRGS